MEQNITAERIANAIMQDSSFDGYYLIVEGKKDLKLYSKFINNNTVYIKIAFGHEKVRNVLEILDERGFSKRFGIIDSDFNKILGINESIEGLFITDDHDIEVMIFKTKALEDVLNIFCSKDMLDDFEKKSEKSIRESLLTIGKEMGYLKLANNMYDLGLVFKPKNPDGNHIKYVNFVSAKTFKFLGKKKLIETVINYSRNKVSQKLDFTNINDKFDKISKQDIDLYQLVNGHDISNFLFILMKKILKSSNKLLVDFNCIEDCLILAYDFASFSETELYLELLNWGKDKGVDIFENNDS